MTLRRSIRFLMDRLRFEEIEMILGMAHAPKSSASVLTCLSNDLFCVHESLIRLHNRMAKVTVFDESTAGVSTRIQEIVEALSRDVEALYTVLADWRNS